MYIYPTTFRSRMTGIVYIFYIGFYIYEGKAYKHLAFIVPQDSGVFANGCYIKRVNAGVYVYKPLDYQRQCWQVRNQAYCSDEYSFIGSAFQGMWPLTMFDIPPEVAAGASSGFTISNEKQKKRNEEEENRKTWRAIASGAPLGKLLGSSEKNGGRRRRERTKKRSSRKSRKTMKRR